MYLIKALWRHKVSLDIQNDDAHKSNADIIMKTCLYNFDPLKPLFYTVKLGFTGVYISFLISA